MHRVQISVVLQQEPNESSHVSGNARPILHGHRVPGQSGKGTPVDQYDIVVACLQQGIADLLSTALLATGSLLRESVEVEYRGMVPVEVGLSESACILQI